MKLLSKQSLFWVLLLIIGGLVIYNFFDDLTMFLMAYTVFATIVAAFIQSTYQHHSTDITPTTKNQFKWPWQFKRQYLELMRYLSRDFDIKGLRTQPDRALDLEIVFEELHLRPEPAHQAKTSLLSDINSDLSKENITVWGYLDAIERAGKPPNLVVVGPPGSGKTTLLRHICMVLSTPRRHRQYPTKYDKIPILLYLRELTQQFQTDKTLHLPQMLELTLRRWDIDAPVNWIRKQLKKGNCLVMLDGLDEIADQTIRNYVVGWVEDQIRAYPKNAFILTSRPYGYRENPINGANVLEVMPFTRAQINRFVHKWYLANEIKERQSYDDGVRIVANRGAKELLNRLDKNTTLLELAVNPLLLTMIATVHQYRSSLPERRAELYSEIFEVFLGKRKRSKGLEIDLSPGQKQSVLQPLAYEMMCNKQLYVRKDKAAKIIQEPLSLVRSDMLAEDFIDSIQNQSGLFLENERGIYGFAHKTFQEYLASVHILDRQCESELFKHIEDDWWHETIRLYAAQTDASNLVGACLQSESPWALSVAIQCADEALQIEPSIKQEIQDVLFRDAESLDLQRRLLVSATLLAKRIKQMPVYMSGVYVDKKLITNIEYQSYVADMQTQQVDAAPADWKSGRFPPGTAHKPVLGVSYLDAKKFCEWLVEEMDYQNVWTIRLPYESELSDPDYENRGCIWLENQSEVLCYGDSDNWPVLSREQFNRLVIEDIKKLLHTFTQSNQLLINSDKDNVIVKLGGLMLKTAGNFDRYRKTLKIAAKGVYDKLQSKQLKRPLDFVCDIPKEIKEFDQKLSNYIENNRSKINYTLELLIFDALELTKISFYDYGKSSDRYMLLMLAIVWQYIDEIISSQWFAFSRRGAVESAEKREDLLLDKYANLVIRVARSMNWVNAFEGIIIVKERNTMDRIRNSWNSSSP